MAVIECHAFRPVCASLATTSPVSIRRESRSECALRGSRLPPGVRLACSLRGSTRRWVSGEGGIVGAVLPAGVDVASLVLDYMAILRLASQSNEELQMVGGWPADVDNGANVGGLSWSFSEFHAAVSP